MARKDNSLVRERAESAKTFSLMRNVSRLRETKGMHGLEEISQYSFPKTGEVDDS